MSTPAEELRAAATRLRCDHVFPLQPPEGSMTAPGDCRKCGVPFEDHHNMPIADRLREPLAAWLEPLASGWEKSVEISPGGSDVRFSAHPALAVARVINGGAS